MIRYTLSIIFDTGKLFNTGVHLSASYGLKAFQPTAENTDFVEIKYKADDNYGLLGMSASNVIFALGQNTLSWEADNQIAGWSFDDEKFLIIKKKAWEVLSHWEF